MGRDGQEAIWLRIASAASSSSSRDTDAAGDMALAALTERAEVAGIETLALSPRTEDFNVDLRTFGLGALRAALRIQLAPQDGCFIPDD